MTDVVRGYLSRQRERGVRTLRIPCPQCDLWHSHGAGPEETPGKTTHRASHCGKGPNAYGLIAIQSEPFDPAWRTPRGRKSGKWRGRDGDA